MDVCLSAAPSQLGSCDSTHLVVHRLANSSSQGALPISLPLDRPTIDPALCQLAPHPTAEQLAPRPAPLALLLFDTPINTVTLAHV